MAERAPLRGLMPIRVVRARPRLFISIVCGVATGFLLPSGIRITTKVLLGWNAALLLYFALVALMIAASTAEKIKSRAAAQDEGRFAILILSSLAAAAAFAAIFLELATVKDATPLLKAFHIALAGATIVSSWCFIHLMFTLHYAHEFFFESSDDPALPRETRGGLCFPGTDEPDYFDFLYFSFVIGVACQTADVEISSRAMRRVSLVHSVVAFFFNSALLALTINIAAGLI